MTFVRKQRWTKIKESFDEVEDGVYWGSRRLEAESMWECRGRGQEAERDERGQKHCGTRKWRSQMVSTLECQEPTVQGTDRGEPT